LVQKPQFVGSVMVLAQPVVHCISLLAQVAEHLPCEHSWPPVQTVPQAPQLLESDVTLTQPVAHAFNPAVH
jgi:hypothetical protein